jgi:hypothetical protein
LIEANANTVDSVYRTHAILLKAGLSPEEIEIIRNDFLNSHEVIGYIKLSKDYEFNSLDK